MQRRRCAAKRQSAAPHGFGNIAGVGSYAGRAEDDGVLQLAAAKPASGIAAAYKYRAAVGKLFCGIAESVEFLSVAYLDVGSHVGKHFGKRQIRNTDAEYYRLPARGGKEAFLYIFR